MGRKRQPFYRVVVVPRQNKPGRGRYVEKLGWVDPLQHTNQINHERVQFWLSNGAQPSDTAWNLFVREGIVDGDKRKKGTIKSKKEESATSTEEVAEEPTKEEPKEDAPKEEKKEDAPVEEQKGNDSDGKGDKMKPEDADPSGQEGSPDTTEESSGKEE